jgi:hypothetical protein
MAFLNRNILPPKYLRRVVFLLKNWLFLTLSENANPTLQAYLLYNINIYKKKINVYLSSLMMKVPDHVYVLG